MRKEGIKREREGKISPPFLTKRVRLFLEIFFFFFFLRFYIFFFQNFLEFFHPILMSYQRRPRVTPGRVELNVAPSSLTTTDWGSGVHSLQTLIPILWVPVISGREVSLGTSYVIWGRCLSARTRWALSFVRSIRRVRAGSNRLDWDVRPS